ncbi:MAG: pyridoxamine 5'-phosphate oxidase family protein, partial [Oscillospiraceae bacterium]|nr:pyridoxamine 5'-phosphate oxidase family protein [Oscillospiraceae bacterium]
RKHTQLADEVCIEVLKSETRGVLSVLGDDDYPYGMPMNHFYNEEDGKIYFHCGNIGHRLDSLKKHNKVSFCCYDQGYINEGQWHYNVKSVIAFGKIEIVDDMDKIVDISTKLCAKFPCGEGYAEKEIAEAAHRTLILEMTVEHMCGKLVTEL